MIFLNIVLLIGVIGFLCWLLFTLAVYALPLFVGVTAGLWAHGSGAGIVGGIAAGATAIIGQLIFDFARPNKTSDVWRTRATAVLLVERGRQTVASRPCLIQQVGCISVPSTSAVEASKCALGG